MILICVIVALFVIGIICALIKANIDDQFEDSSMKRYPKLSLRRNRCNETCGTRNDPVEISDDESFDMYDNVQKSTRECTSVRSHGSAGVSSSVASVSSLGCQRVLDSSSDGDVIIVDDGPSTFRSPSLFNWKSPIKRQKLMNEPRRFNSSFSDKPKQKLMNEPGRFNSSFSDKPEQKLMNEPRRFNSNFNDKPDSDILMSDEDILPPQHNILIAGTNIKFPVKPYSCQIAVMNSLINGCTREQNCLLESPTGSGKTLALLCGALGWQEKYSEEIRREQNNGMDVENSYSDNDCYNDNFLLNPSQYFDEELPDNISHKDKPRKVPKIYYGTRTHKQIEQVIREFKKTAYKHKSMTILSSREHTCIQNSKRNKDDLCNELLDPLKGKSCPYYEEHNSKTTTFSAMDTPWDIEDLVSLGKRVGACPYFGARSLMANAEIIFCPYNYILDPDIRESMQINLRGNIVILDEAHNIEDACREKASVNLRDDEITNATKECEHLSYKGRNRHIYDIINKYLTDVVKFLQNIEVKDFNDWEMTSNCWLGIEFRVLLDMNNIGCSRFATFHTATNAAIEDFIKNTKEMAPEKRWPTISRDTRKILEHLCFAMQMIISDNFVNDYRVYVIETMEPRKIATNDVWISPTATSKIKVRTMKLICLNPAVNFAPLARTVRSVILASGTLTPITSFQSELDTQFPHIVNPNHIVPNDQVFIRCISYGPNKKPLLAKFKHMNTYEFQDELGNLILQVCDSVPYGVLCFFSSYETINLHYERWDKNGMLTKLSELKKIFVEPKNKSELNGVMEEYRSTIKKSSSQSFRVACGAILFAVFRGKVAEGIDFSNNQARCVLAIGIPYLPLKNDVKMKMEYNDLNKKPKNLLSGSDWYTVNAFRALNQGIGRCVRHQSDWGAVLLVDKRFQQPQSNYKVHLPKWIKSNIKSNDDYDLEIELQDFVAIQAARERGEKCTED